MIALESLLFKYAPFLIAWLLLLGFESMMMPCRESNLLATHARVLLLFYYGSSDNSTNLQTDFFLLVLKNC